ncbi:MAG: hypothetical protein ACM3ML_02530 [Micromonosporaceae bacterium]
MSEEVKDPADMLMRALGTLPPDDRDAVLAWLLRGAFRGAGISQFGPLRQMLRTAQLGRSHEYIASYAPAAGRPQPGAQQVVPVRFPMEQHAQLRDWCAEHGFSMATVIRGLVTRFLETQLPERN